MRNKRLMKKIAEEHYYKFVSPWFVEVEAVVDGDIHHEFSDTLSPATALNSEDESAAVRAFNTAWNSEAISIIEEHIAERIGVNVKFSIELADKVYATVMADEKLNDEQINEIIDELTGQYADGVGEGLEQREFLDFEDDELSYFDDISNMASDNFSFEDWCENYGYDIPEEDSDEYDELYGEYENATIDITYTNVKFYIKMWQGEDFEIKLVK